MECIKRKSKNAIKSQASIRNLATQYQINNFWETRDLREVKLNVSDEILNETLASSKFVNTEYMDNVAAEMKRRFNR